MLISQIQGKKILIALKKALSGLLLVRVVARYALAGYPLGDVSVIGSYLDDCGM